MSNAYMEPPGITTMETFETSATLCCRNEKCKRNLQLNMQEIDKRPFYRSNCCTRRGCLLASKLVDLYEMQLKNIKKINVEGDKKYHYLMVDASTNTSEDTVRVTIDQKATIIVPEAISSIIEEIPIAPPVVVPSLDSEDTIAKEEPSLNKNEESSISESDDVMVKPVDEYEEEYGSEPLDEPISPKSTPSISPRSTPRGSTKSSPRGSPKSSPRSTKDSTTADMEIDEIGPPSVSQRVLTMSSNNAAMRTYPKSANALDKEPQSMLLLPPSSENEVKKPLSSSVNWKVASDETLELKEREVTRSLEDAIQEAQEKAQSFRRGNEGPTRSLDEPVEVDENDPNPLALLQGESMFKSSICLDNSTTNTKCCSFLRKKKKKPVKEKRKSSTQPVEQQEPIERNQSENITIDKPKKETKFDDSLLESEAAY